MNALAKYSSGEEPTMAAKRLTLSSTDPLARGARIDHYVVQHVLAAGGFGTVYRATHRVLGREVAIKVLHRDLAAAPEMVARFVREARAVNAIRHPNIVDIFDFGELADGRPYLVMELLDGETLEERLRDGRLTPHEVIVVVEPICAALSAAHRAGYVHRDLKITNVMLVGDSVKLLDFGIAKLIHADGQPALTARGERLGSIHAMSPEQLRGEPIDQRADIYALGVMLFQLLTGRLPFPGPDAVSFERQHLEQPAPVPSQVAPVSRAIDAVVATCLAKSPSDRFVSCDELIAALREACGIRAPRRSVGGVALHARVELADDATDDDLEEIAAALAAISDELAAQHYRVVSLTGDSLLAVRAAKDHELPSAIDQICEVARSLHVPLPRGSQLELAINADSMVVAGETPVDGPLLSPDSWPPSTAWRFR